MNWTGRALTQAYAEALTVSHRTGRPVSIVADDGRRWYGLKKRGWRVEPFPTAADTVLISDITLAPSRDLLAAYSAVVQEAPDIADVLRRTLLPAMRHTDGTERPVDERLFLLAELAMVIDREEQKARDATDLALCWAPQHGRQEAGH